MIWLFNAEVRSVLTSTLCVVTTCVESIVTGSRLWGTATIACLSCTSKTMCMLQSTSLQVRLPGLLRQEVRTMSTINTGPNTFNHSGDIGDTIYAMPTVRALGGGYLYMW